MKTQPFVCRNCGSNCPILVTLDGEQVIKVEGDFAAPLYRGYTCPKGRALPQEHHNPQRLLHSLKRMPDGRHVPISSEQLVEEIAEKVGSIIDAYGPQAVGAFMGNAIGYQPATSGMLLGFLTAIGSPLLFSNGTLDQPGLSIALALHGGWQGGRVHSSQWGAKLLVGGNPVVSKQHLPQNPAWQLKELERRGLKLIVIDPRKTETARRAAVHLQAIAGEDPTVLAGLVHLIFALDGVNEDFVRENAKGAADLEEAVSAFTPEYVSDRAGISTESLFAAARILVETERGDTALGVGPSMATRGTLSSYLALCIQTLRGWWAREGDPVARPRVMMPALDWRAQPQDPRPGWGFGFRTSVRELQQTIAGMPAAAAPELMLSNGEDRIRAFFSHGGIYYSWPETEKTVKALRSLDLFVTHDVEMTSTAELADYVIATYTQLETPAMSQIAEMVGEIHPGYDWHEPYGFYHEPVVKPPEGSDLMESWQVYYRVAQKLGLSLDHVNFSFVGGASDPIPHDMEHEPRTADLLEMMCAGSAVPISEVKMHPHGVLFEHARAVVGPREAACTSRLELADTAMLEQLAEVRRENPQHRRGTTEDFPFQLICRRMIPSTCSGHRVPGLVRTGYNPLWMHPSDMSGLGLADGDPVEVRSRHGVILTFVEGDDTMRPGVVATSFGFGRKPGKNYEPRKDGSNVNQLISWDDDPDPYHGMPRMSALPVRIQSTAQRSREN